MSDGLFGLPSSAMSPNVVLLVTAKLQLADNRRDCGTRDTSNRTRGCRLGSGGFFHEQRLDFSTD
jgi:hypothetical protein